ncbi:MAG: excinuclease ABC subunit B, partial [Candidatus Afipia apatlaquensis]|nr:excinuclease ABC subunit B [Candidatus Afipia apatlaquensis]
MLATRSSSRASDEQLHMTQMRLATTASLMSRRDVIVVASVSCIYGLGNPENFQSMGFELKVHDRVQRRALL